MATRLGDLPFKNQYDAWVDQANKAGTSGEVRAREGQSGTEIYTSKRGLLGKAFAFVKDPAGAESRAAKQKAGTEAFTAFMQAQFGGRTAKLALQHSLTPGGPLTGDQINKAIGLAKGIERQNAYYDANEAMAMAFCTDGGKFAELTGHDRLTDPASKDKFELALGAELRKHPDYGQGVMREDQVKEIAQKVLDRTLQGIKNETAATAFLTSPTATGMADFNGLPQADKDKVGERFKASVREHPDFATQDMTDATFKPLLQQRTTDHLAGAHVRREIDGDGELSRLPQAAKERLEERTLEAVRGHPDYGQAEIDGPTLGGLAKPILDEARAQKARTDQEVRAFEPGGVGFATLTDGGRLPKDAAVGQDFRAKLQAAVLAHPDYGTADIAPADLQGLAQTALDATLAEVQVKTNLETTRNFFANPGIAKPEGFAELAPAQQTHVQRQVEAAIRSRPEFAQADVFSDRLGELTQAALDGVRGQMGKTGTAAATFFPGGGAAFAQLTDHAKLEERFKPAFADALTDAVKAHAQFGKADIPADELRTLAQQALDETLGKQQARRNDKLVAQFLGELTEKEPYQDLDLGELSELNKAVLEAAKKEPDYTRQDLTAKKLEELAQNAYVDLHQDLVANIQPEELEDILADLRAKDDQRV